MQFSNIVSHGYHFNTNLQRFKAFHKTVLHSVPLHFENFPDVIVLWPLLSGIVLTNLTNTATKTTSTRLLFISEKPTIPTNKPYHSDPRTPTTPGESKSGNIISTRMTPSASQGVRASQNGRMFVTVLGGNKLTTLGSSAVFTGGTFEQWFLTFPCTQLFANLAHEV